MKTANFPLDVSSYCRPSTEHRQTDAILTAAEACFSRAGYAGASMREIAEAAGVSKSLLHYYFQSKEHVFVEVQVRAFERLAARVVAVVASMPNGKDRGLAAFDALVSALGQSNELGAQAELAAGALSNERLRAHLVRLREFLRELLVRNVQELLGSDLERAGVTVEMAADFLLSVLTGVGMSAAFGEPPEQVDNAIQAVRFLADVMLSNGDHAVPQSNPASPEPSRR